MTAEKLSYNKAADHFLRSYYENNADTTVYLMYSFTRTLVQEAKLLAKAVSLKDMDYQDALVATWFRYCGLTKIPAGSCEERTKLLRDFFNISNYPQDHRSIVETAINNVSDNKAAETKVQQVVSDAIYSQFAQPDFIENIILLKDEVNRLTSDNNTELFYLQYYFQLFIKARYYTAYAYKNYSALREKNFLLLEKRIHKIDEAQKSADRTALKINGPSTLSDKETEDLFKIAFRNYNQLISVADSKASLLINVNSIIISVMLGFVLSRVEHNVKLLWPTIILLIVSLTTIFLSVLASRPQKNFFLEDKASHSYQRFFFGSFDLIDPSFKYAGWDNYFRQLNEFFTSSRETVYLELYKETYNVRKVLAKKFNYLSIAYWVFIIGLMISITAFIIAIQSQKVI